MYEKNHEEDLDTFAKAVFEKEVTILENEFPVTKIYDALKLIGAKPDE
jgi:hypothetical protein